MTLMSKQLFKELGLKSNGSVQLKNVKVDSVMEGSIVSSFDFQLGGKRYCSDVMAADIEDEFILGFDFLKAAGCKLDLMNGTLETGTGEIVHAIMKQDGDGQKYYVSQVVLQKSSTVAPGSVRFLRAKLESPAGVNFVLEPKQAGPLLIIPSICQGKTPKVRVAVVNLLEESASLPRNFVLAQAVEADVASELSEDRIRGQSCCEQWKTECG